MSEAVAEAVKSPEDRGVARVAWLEAAVGSRPADGTAWGRLGRAYREVGQDELALRALRRAADLGTRESDDWYWLSVLARRAGHRAEALAAARVAARQATGGSRELVNLATQLLEHDKPHEAIPYLDEAMRLAPGRPEPIGLLGIAHYDAGRYGAAAECLEAALRIHPDDNVHAWARLGVSLDESGRPEAAVHALETAVFASPDYGWAWGRLGKALRTLGRHREAVAAYEKSLLHGFAPPMLLADMGDSAAETGNVTCLSEAIRRLKPVDRKAARALNRRLDELQAAASSGDACATSSQGEASASHAVSMPASTPASAKKRRSLDWTHFQ